MAIYFLTVEDGKLTGYTEAEVARALHTEAAVRDFLGEAERRGFEVYCSSSLDFPEEQTDDPAVLALVEGVNNGFKIDHAPVARETANTFHAGEL